MPLVRIDITGPKPAPYKRALLSGARIAVTQSLGVPDDRVTVRVTETPAECIDAPASRTDRFTVVEVLMFEGRTPKLKAALAAALREAFAGDPGIEPSEVVIAVRDANPVDLDILPGQATAN